MDLEKVIGFSDRARSIDRQRDLARSALEQEVNSAEPAKVEAELTPEERFSALGHRIGVLPMYSYVNPAGVIGRGEAVIPFSKIGEHPYRSDKLVLKLLTVYAPHPKQRKPDRLERASAEWVRYSIEGGEEVPDTVTFERLDLENLKTGSDEVLRQLALLEESVAEAEQSLASV
ncbi:MAG TPA: hypothetical protein VIH90_05595 [Candidatus Saccharimonadales bacterium]